MTRSANATFEKPDTVWAGDRWRFVDFNRETRKYETEWEFAGYSSSDSTILGVEGKSWTTHYNQVTVVSDAEALFRLFGFQQSRGRNLLKNTTPAVPQKSAWPKDKPFQLSKCLQWLLGPYFRGQGEFRGFDIGEIELYEGLPESITKFAVIDAGAITIWKSIYFAPNQYSDDLDGIELVAHELTHVKQWILNGQIGFPSKYGAEFK